MTDETDTLSTRLGDIPCFRKTFLVSISSGLAAGFGYFMLTSKPRRASHVGYGTFFGVTFVYWAYCRYKWSVERAHYEILKAAVREANIMEGTEQVNVEAEKLKSELKSA